MNSGSRKPFVTSPPLVAVGSWMLPGLGYLLIGQTARGIVVGATIITMFLSGMLLAGVRVIDVPGYDRTGREVKIRSDGVRLESTARDPDYSRSPSALVGRGLFGEIVNKPWYVCQILNGPICLVSSSASLAAARRGVLNSHARIYEIGTLYTAVAGLLNLLVIIDCGHRAARLKERRT